MASLAPHRKFVTEFEAYAGRGQRFQPTIERELDADLRSLAERLPGADDGLMAVVEFPGPRGVPDLLVVSRGFEALGQRLSADVPYIDSPADCAVVAELSLNRTRTAASVAAASGMSIGQVERRLRALALTGATVPQGAGYRRHPSVEPIGRTYAFEAKVSDWRRGLSQALTYSSWADASVLVLLRAPRDTDELERRCEALNVGLAIRDTWVRRPRIGRPHRSLRLEASERLASEVSRLNSEAFPSGIRL